MPSSLAVLLPPALGSSPHPPVSVYGTGMHRSIAAFLGTRPSRFATPISLRLTPPGCRAVFLARPLLRLHRSLHSRPATRRMRPHSSGHAWCRNLHLLPIGYASLPRLRPRLTQGRSALPWNPWIFGRKDSHLPLATHSGILSSRPSTAPYGAASMGRQCSPTSIPRPPRSRKNPPGFFSGRPKDGRCSWASAVCFSPGHFRRRTSRLVSYYALFECMAASEPTS